jgi:hypothetical protein
MELSASTARVEAELQLRHMPFDLAARIGFVEDRGHDIEETSDPVSWADAFLEASPATVVRT